MRDSRLLLPLALLIVFTHWSAFAQAQSPRRDDLLDHMAGTWKMDGQVMGRDAHH